MALKTFKPYTKSTRGTILTSREGLWKGKPYKPLTSANYSSKGRNNYGRITSRNHGGGHKHKYRKIDFYRKKNNMKAIVERIEYDPNRSCHIMLVKFEDNQKYYYLAPQKIKVGDHVQNVHLRKLKQEIVYHYRTFLLVLIYIMLKYNQVVVEKLLDRLVHQLLLVVLMVIIAL